MLNTKMSQSTFLYIKLEFGIYVPLHTYRFSLTAVDRRQKVDITSTFVSARIGIVNAHSLAFARLERYLIRHFEHCIVGHTHKAYLHCLLGRIAELKCIAILAAYLKVGERQKLEVGIQSVAQCIRTLFGYGMIHRRDVCLNP